MCLHLSPSGALISINRAHIVLSLHDPKRFGADTFPHKFAKKKGRKRNVRGMPRLTNPGRM